jgi:hypothetical protein
MSLSVVRALLPRAVPRVSLVTHAQRRTVVTVKETKASTTLASFCYQTDIHHLSTPHTRLHKEQAAMGTSDWTIKA